jgi:hypothetical protein
VAPEATADLYKLEARAVKVELQGRTPVEAEEEAVAVLTTALPDSAAVPEGVPGRRKAATVKRETQAHLLPWSMAVLAAPAGMGRTRR